jgi:hypothetical protein
MLGRVSTDVWDHFDGDDDPDLSAADRGIPWSCAIEEGFLLKTLREDFPLNSGTAAVFAEAFPNPNLEAEAFSGLVWGIANGAGEVSRKPGLGRPVCGALLTELCPLFGSICPEICAISASLCSSLLVPGCMDVPCLLLRGASPGRVGGSNPDLYDAILLIVQSPPHYFV